MPTSFVSITHYATRKSISIDCDQDGRKPACSATETEKNLENVEVTSKVVILFRQRTTMIRIRLCGSGGGGGGTLIFSYIRRLGSFLGVQHLKFQYFWRFSEK